MHTSGAPRSTSSRTSRKTAETADHTFNAAFELVMTPALFAFIGYLIDGRLNTAPVFTLGLAVLVAVYEVWKLWYGYNLRVDRLHAEMMRPTPRLSIPAPVTGDDS